jgi:hypothetical protein
MAMTIVLNDMRTAPTAAARSPPSKDAGTAGFDCHIRYGADCDTDVRGHQRGASLNPIADHRNALRLLLHVIDRLAY